MITSRSGFDLHAVKSPKQCCNPSAEMRLKRNTKLHSDRALLGSLGTGGGLYLS